MAAIYDWDIDQMDAISAFLNSVIQGDVYMEVPPLQAELLGLPIDQIRGKVCKLLKGLYGLKQAPWLWQQKLKTTLTQLGFQPLLTDDSVYIKTWLGGSKDLIILVMYVDDMLICGPNSKLISQFKQQLSNAFDMQDLGPVTYFLGVRIVRNRADRSIQLIQDAYIRKVMKRYNLEDSKSTSTPLQQGSVLISNPDRATKADTEVY